MYEPSVSRCSPPSMTHIPSRKTSSPVTAPTILIISAGSTVCDMLPASYMAVSSRSTPNRGWNISMFPYMPRM